MRIKAKSFEFTSYKFEPGKKRVRFSYKIDFFNRDPLTFTETIFLPRVPALKSVPKGAVDNLLRDLHIILGISYYKLYCPPMIKLGKSLTKEQADFWNTAYRKGLGEFCYKNKIDPKKIAKFPYGKNVKTKSYELAQKDRILVGIGGGKDSIVAVELFKEQKHDITAFVLETEKSYGAINKVVSKMNIGSLKIKRFLDKKIFEDHADSYNGHIPISAIYYFLGMFSALLYDYSYVAIANGQSTNIGNVKYKGEMVNHQWSKASEFEEMLQSYTGDFICHGITCFSPIRPFYEIRLVELLAKYKKYHKYFTSCNKSYRILSSQKKLWCGQCPKCAFVFTLLAAFLQKKELIAIFGKNFFADKSLLPTFRDILGFGKIKPFDCVGPFEETKAALYLARKEFRNDLAVKKFLPRISGAEKLVKQVFKTHPAPTVPTKFQFMGMKNVLLLGYGKEGKVTKQYLKKYFPKLKVGIADAKHDPKYLDKQEGYDIAVKTPGLPKRLMTIPYTTATNIFFSQVKNTIIGVTGTKGKSTTVSLIHAILKEAGKKVYALGNIGEPMLGALLGPVKKDVIFVLEMSSYQLDDILFSPKIAVALNLFPDHLTYHGDMKIYTAAKKNIINFQAREDVFIYNSKYNELAAWAKESKAKTSSFNKTVLPAGIKLPLKGRHNRENIQAALAVAKLFNIPTSTVKKALESFKPLPHRLEFIGEFKGIKFYDDAISTTPESTIMAIKALKKVGTIFLGGEDRGYDFSDLEKVIRKFKIKNIVLFPDTGKRMFKSKNGLNVLQTSSMEKAVKFAYQKTKKGQICLLSTASPSFSLWKDYRAKGKLFQKLVKKYP